MTIEPEPTDREHKTRSLLTGVAGALAEASRHVWAHAEGHPSPAALESLALGIQLVQANVCALMPLEPTAESFEPESKSGWAGEAMSPRLDDGQIGAAVGLLVEAERQVRELRTRLDLMHITALAVEMRELLREARDVNG